MILMNDFSRHANSVYPLVSYCSMPIYSVGPTNPRKLYCKVRGIPISNLGTLHLREAGGTLLASHTKLVVARCPPPLPPPPCRLCPPTQSLPHSLTLPLSIACLPPYLTPSLPCSSSMGLTHSPDSEIHIERWSPTPKNPEQTVYFCQFVAARPSKTPCFLPLLIQYTWLGTATPRESVLLLCSARFSCCSKCARYLQCYSIFLSANDMFRICRDESGGGGREREGQRGREFSHLWEETMLHHQHVVAAGHVCPASRLFTQSLQASRCRRCAWLAIPLHLSLTLLIAARGSN